MVESYKHQFAKLTLARWLADPEQKLVQYSNWGGGPLGCGVFLEYPVCINSDGKLIGEEAWQDDGAMPVTSRAIRWSDTLENDVPTYQQCLDVQLLPICIFDVALHHRGSIAFAFEIVHKNGLTKEKRDYIERVLQESSLISVYGVDADWILSQVGLPDKVKTLWTLGR